MSGSSQQGFDMVFHILCCCSWLCTYLDIICFEMPRSMIPFAIEFPMRIILFFFAFCCFSFSFSFLQLLFSSFYQGCLMVVWSRLCHFSSVDFAFLSSTSFLLYFLPLGGLCLGFLLPLFRLLLFPLEIPTFEAFDKRLFIINPGFWCSTWVFRVSQIYGQ